MRKKLIKRAALVGLATLFIFAMLFGIVTGIANLARGEDAEGFCGLVVCSVALCSACAIFKKVRETQLEEV